MKAIFLEIDGVIIHETSRVIARVLQQELTAYKRSVDALNLISHGINPKIVVISPRRAMGLGLLMDRFQFWGVTSRDLDVGPTGTKEEQVFAWLKKSTDWGFSKIDSFVIIDCESVYREEFSSHFVKVDDHDGGLNMEQAQQAIEILKRGIPWTV